MRAVFGVVSLLVVMAIVGVLVSKQLAGAPTPAAPPVAGASADVPVRPTGTPQQQVQQMQKSVEQAVQQARPMPDDK